MQWTGLITVIGLLGLVFRGVFLFETPTLSQDFFRFIWDGHHLLNGFNPYTSLPDELIENGAAHIPHANYLYDNMGSLSSGNYSNYPPLNQFFFVISAYLGGESLLGTVVAMRLFIISADVLIFIYGVRLLQMMRKPTYLIMLYLLNPFIIIELTGNLHWEGVMAAFTLMSIYYLLRLEFIKSAWLLGNGILLKLMPVLILPLFIKRIEWSKLIVFYLFVGFVVVCGFIPFFSEQLYQKYGSSVGLWFGKFEFNASIYYIIRAIGYKIIGYNLIETVGKILPVITFIGVWLIALLRKNQLPEVLLESIVFSFLIYYLLSTTVHPWYLTIPLLISIFTNYRFMVLWSALVFLSYSAYGNSNFEENLWLVAVEYILVLGYFIYELIAYHKLKKKQHIAVASSFNA